MAKCATCGSNVPDIGLPSIVAERITAKEHIAIYHEKMLTVRMISCYAISSLFAVVGALIIVFAPDNRETATIIVALALFIFAVGIAGLTHFRAKMVGVDISGDHKPESN